MVRAEGLWVRVFGSGFTVYRLDGGRDTRGVGGSGFRVQRLGLRDYDVGLRREREGER
jgi:hypothetical protein